MQSIYNRYSCSKYLNKQANFQYFLVEWLTGARFTPLMGVALPCSPYFQRNCTSSLGVALNCSLSSTRKVIHIPDVAFTCGTLLFHFTPFSCLTDIAYVRREWRLSLLVIIPGFYGYWHISSCTAMLLLISDIHKIGITLHCVL